MKAHIDAVLAQKLSSLIPISADPLETPKDPSHGDYALPCFAYAKLLKKSPVQIVTQISEALAQDPEFTAMATLNPINGFLNLILSDAYIWTQFLDALSSHKYTQTQQPICLEFVSANPTGPLHIGHGRWAAMGDSLARLLAYTGHQVHKEFYINDAGNQINLFRASIAALRNHQSIPENGYHGAYVKEIANTAGDAIQNTLAQQRQTLCNFGVEFDQWFSEQSLHDSGAIPEAFKVLEAAGYLYQEAGATWFKTTEFGDDKDRVLIKADGAYTYFAVDIAYHWNKIKRNYHQLIGILGADHHGYINRLKATVAALSSHENRSVELTIIIGQLVNLFRAKEPIRMSKRTGEMITLSEVIEEIGVDATRFFLINQSSNNSIDFDLELAKSKSHENPVYYLQYAHARICRILEQAPEIPPHNPLTRSWEPQERQLLLCVARFRDHIQEATLKMDPSKLSSYSYEIARNFHSFYNACPILNTQSPDPLRIQICIQVKNALKTCCDLMGISTPESM